MLSLRGHIPDDIAPDKWTPLSVLVGASPSPAPAESRGVALWADRIESQPGQSCVGHGIAGAVYAKAGAANAAIGQPDRPRTYPAPLGIYYDARAKGGRAYLDGGSQPRLAYEGLSDYGYCAIEDWPSLESNILLQPPAGAYRLAADQRVIQYYRIVNEGDQACEDVRQAISQQNPVTLALQLDASFVNLKDNVWNGPTGKIVGGHYVFAVEYTPEYVVLVNSWGRGFGVNGRCKVAWSVIGNPKVTTDRYAITFAPLPVVGVA